jgi:hypothetical protein
MLCGERFSPFTLLNGVAEGSPFVLSLIISHIMFYCQFHVSSLLYRFPHLSPYLSTLTVSYRRPIVLVFFIFLLTSFFLDEVYRSGSGVATAEQFRSKGGACALVCEEFFYLWHQPEQTFDVRLRIVWGGPEEGMF